MSSEEQMHHHQMTNTVMDLASLLSVLPPGQILTSPDELVTYERDASLDQGSPNAVVFPHSTDDVIRIVQYAGARQIPLVARGAGTGISGGAVPVRGGIIVEFSHMNKILEFDETKRQAVVQPGVVTLALDELARSKGLYYPPDPASHRACTLGGNIAENAGGPHCFKYGVTTHYVTSLQVILADGRRVRLGGQALDYPEYDFIGVLTGNEGTLAITTQATLRLIGNPRAVQTMMAAFHSIEEAGEAVSAVIAQGLMPAAMELMDQKMMRVVEDYAQAGLPVEAAAALIIEVDGWPESLSPQIDEIRTILGAFHPCDLRVAKTTEERDRLWHGRRSVAGAIARLAPAFLPVDVTVPRSKLGPTLHAIDRICEAAHLPVGYILHAGDGNVHPDLLIQDPTDRALIQRVLDVAGQILELSVAQGGTITGEHGVGIEKRDFMPLMFSDVELAVMQDVKQVFDPQGLLNPGKIFPQNGDRDQRTVNVPVSAEHPSSHGQGWDSHLPAKSASLEANFSSLTTHPSHISGQCLFPRSTEDAAEAIRACCVVSPPYSIHIRGGGTKSNPAPRADVGLSTRYLNGLFTYAPDDLYVTVGAGTKLVDLQEELNRYQMWVALVSPWCESTVGGIVASNMNGPLRMRYAYGSIRDQVLAATVVLPDGRVIRAGRPLVKNVAGYDIVKLFAGSFGTLGLMTDISLKVTPLPRARVTFIVPLEDPLVGLILGARLLRVCLVASALILCGGCNLPSNASPYALIYTGEGLPEDVRAEAAEVQRVLQEARVPFVKMDDRAPTGSELWGNWLRQVSPDDTLLRIGIAVRAFPGLLQHATSFIADLASGLFHVWGNAGSMACLRNLARSADGYAITLRAPRASQETNPFRDSRSDVLEIMRSLKHCWDPQGLFNPDVLLT